MPLARILMSTWPACGFGSGRFLIAQGFLTSVMTAARIFAPSLTRLRMGGPSTEIQEIYRLPCRRILAHTHRGGFVDPGRCTAAPRAMPRTALLFLLVV